MMVAFLAIVFFLAFGAGLIIGRTSKSTQQSQGSSSYGYSDYNSSLIKKTGLECVKSGDIIRVHDSYICLALVINNVPSEKKMLFKIIYKNGSYGGEKVAEYNSDTFKEFNVLNIEGRDYNNIKITNEEFNYHDAIFDLYEMAVNNQKHKEASILGEAISKIKEIN